MRCPERSPDEAGRILALAEYGIDERKGLRELDPVVDMAVRLFDCPAAAVNMIGIDHVFLASSVGIGECDLRRDVSFCAHTINQDGVMVIEDAMHDLRFHDNPLVAAGLIRFYAGIALRAPTGHALGALCVLDDKPRAHFSAQDRDRLKELASLVSDKLELQRLEVMAKTNSNRFEASAATSPNAIICFDDQARISTCNEAACAMFERSSEEMLGQSIDMLIAKEDRPLAHAGISRVLEGGAPITEATAMTGIRRGGDLFLAELYWSRWHEHDRMHFGAIVRDMTEKRRERDTLYHLANYDTLTGLPNRNLLHQRAAEALAAEEPLAIIFTDLDGFTDINNTLGHAAGDSVLCAVGKRIRDALPEAALVARVGDQEFASLIGNRDPMALDAMAHTINARIAEPIVVDGQEVRLAGNSGIAIAPDHGETADELAGSAELALFEARNAGRGSSFLYIPNLRAEAVARRMYDAELHRAFERHEFMLFYQPQVRLSDGALVGAEALIRWRHPIRGLLCPAAFMPSLEAGVLAEPVGQWVLETACRQAVAWRERHPSFCMSVNLSAAQFRDGNLPALVRQLLRACGLPPEALELEITENIILNQHDLVLTQIEQLRSLGVALSFDDFGTGFASLNLLRNFPVTQIKIDKSFTRVIQSSEKDRVIVTGLIDMAQQLGLKVVAEGIEHQIDADFLTACGCEKGQGFLYGKPLPAEVFEDRFLSEQPVFGCDLR